MIAQGCDGFQGWVLLFRHGHGRSGTLAEPIWMRVGVLGNLVQNGVNRHLRSPTPRSFGQARIEDDPRRIQRPGFRSRADRVGAEAFRTPRIELM